MRTITQIQREDRVGYVEAKRRYCAQFELAPADGSVHVGDKYRRSEATVTITRVTETHVFWDFEYRGDVDKHSATHEDFNRMEANSLKWGASFEPAPLNTKAEG